MEKTFDTHILIFGFFLSIVLLLVGVILALRLWIRSRESHNNASAWATYTTISFVAILVLVLTQNVASDSGHLSMATFISATFETLTMFLANRGIELPPSVIQQLGSLGSAYYTYNSLTYLIAPVSTICAVASLLSSLFVYPRLLLASRGADVFVFSDLNSHSRALANSIVEHYSNGQPARQNAKKCLIVFSGTDSSSEGAAKGQVPSKRLVVCSSPIEVIHEQVSRSVNRVTYLLSSEDEDENLDRGMRLAQNLSQSGARHHPARIYIFSTSPAAGHLVDAMTKEMSSRNASAQLFVRRVDWIRSVVDALLDEWPLFLTGVDNEGSSDHAFDTDKLYSSDSRKVLIVGSGRLAYEYLKGAIWASCLGPSISVSIVAVSPEAHSLRSSLCFDAPEILNGCADRKYPVTFHDCDLRSEKFADFLRNSAGEVTIALIDTGNELTNVQLAIRMREIEQQEIVRKQASDPTEEDYRYNSAIFPVVESDALASSLNQLRDSHGQSYSLQAIGNERVTYSYNHIFQPTLERYAKGVNRAYFEAFDGNRSYEAADKAFECSEYNRLSSTATAIHIKYGLYVHCWNIANGLYKGKEVASFDPVGCSIDWTLPTGEINPTLLHSYDRYMRSTLHMGNEWRGAKSEETVEGARSSWRCAMEHDRWNAYMRVMGYECAGPNEVEAFHPITRKNRDDLAKLHNCLVSFEELPRVDSEYLTLTKQVNASDSPSDSDSNPLYELSDVEVIAHLPEILGNPSEH